MYLVMTMTVPRAAFRRSRKNTRGSVKGLGIVEPLHSKGGQPILRCRIDGEPVVKKNLPVRFGALLALLPLLCLPLKIPEEQLKLRWDSQWIR